MHVAGKTTDEATNTRRLDLGDNVGGRPLAILIGPAQATAIDSALQQVAHSRPMTHDALKEIVDLPRPPILVPSSMLDAPPATVIKGIKVRRVCGQGIVIDADMLESGTAVGGLAEAVQAYPGR